jgi:hypothetical protein
VLKAVRAVDLVPATPGLSASDRLLPVMRMTEELALGYFGQDHRPWFIQALAADEKATGS